MAYRDGKDEDSEAATIFGWAAGCITSFAFLIIAVVATMFWMYFECSTAFRAEADSCPTWTFPAVSIGISAAALIAFWAVRKSALTLWANVQRRYNDYLGE